MGPHSQLQGSSAQAHAKTGADTACLYGLVSCCCPLLQNLMAGPWLQPDLLPDV